MIRTFAHAHNFLYQYRSKLMTVFLTAIMVAICVYGFNVYMIIARAVALKHTETRIADLRSTVYALDAKYLSISGKITPDILHSYGLSQDQSPTFITRASSLTIGEIKSDSRNIGYGL